MTQSTGPYLLDGKSGVPTGLIGGDYELLEKLAEGGMGVVYRAWQRSLQRSVALKMIRGDRSATSTLLPRFRAEAQVIAQIDHAHVVPIYEVGEHEGQPFFTMKLMEGGSLAERLRQAPLSNREAARVLVGVARAIHQAHQRGILHRDLKPGNILFDGEGEAYVADFGLAKQLQGQDHQTTGGIVGTACYMAPEQAAPEARLGFTPATDVYGLGATLYEMLTGRPPFKAATFDETLRQVRFAAPARPGLINEEIDPELEAICLSCLEKDPDQRYDSAEELARDLERYLNGLPTVRASCLPWWHRMRRGLRRLPERRPEQLRAWGRLTLGIALDSSLACLCVYWLIRFNTGPLPFLLCDAVCLGLHLLMLHALRGQEGTLGGRARQILLQNHLMILVFFMVTWLPLGPALAEQGIHRMAVFHLYAIFNGINFTLQGRLWIGFTFLGVLYFIMAVILAPPRPENALLFGALQGGTHGVVGIYMLRQARARTANVTR